MSRKDAYWFSHDSNAAFDPKILRIRAIYGWEGYGVYFGIIEFLRQQSDFKCKKSDSEVNLLATMFNIDFTRLKNIIGDCIRVNLFEVKDEHFYSKSLNNRMKHLEKQRRNGAKPKRSQVEAKLKPSGSQIEAKTEDKSKVSKVNNNIYVDFLRIVNEKTRKAFRGDAKSQRQFSARWREGYRIPDFEKALGAAVQDPYHIETGFKYLTPEFFTRADKLQKFMNLSPAAPKSPSIYDKFKTPPITTNPREFFDT